MDNFNVIGNNVVIDSREIAELTGKKHKNVLRDIEKVLDVTGGMLTFEHTYIHPQNNQEYKCYKLPKRETLILVSGYSIELRTKIIDRLEFLEKMHKGLQPSYSINDPIKRAEAWIEEQKQKKLLIGKIEEDKPKVLLADSCLRNDAQMSITDAGKHLNICQKDMFIIMRKHKYLTEKNLPTQKAIDRGILQLKSGEKDGRNYKQSVMTIDNIMNFQFRHMKLMPHQKELF